MVLLPVTLIGWAALACTLLFVSDLPIASLFSLAILVAGFEAIHALHVGVERIGRYVQVYYESSENGPQWETTAMAIGPALPGGGVDPLFTVVFASAAIVNVIPALLPTPDRSSRDRRDRRAPRGVPGAPRAGSRGGRTPARRRTGKLPSHQIGTLDGKIVINSIPSSRRRHRLGHDSVETEPPRAPNCRRLTNLG